MNRVRFMQIFQIALLALGIATPARLVAQDDRTAGAKIFSTNCSGCHGSDGRGGERAPNIATARNISSLADKDIENIVRNGVTGSGMPAFGFLGNQGIADVVAYLRVLQGKTTNTKIVGDPGKGSQLFFGQAGCSTCHMVHGEGGYLASDLTGYAGGLAPDIIRKAILEPEEVVPQGSHVVELVTASGQTVQGIVRAEDNFNLLVQTHDGRFHRYTKSGLKRIHFTGSSLMPRDYKSRLTAVQVDDIISYLLRAADSISPIDRPAKRSAE